ncbi:hypothetical protein DB30_02518 [Enhygromyxa salina]|uniref:Uncharacterized protein n=1 Tax=Enhygromyxa salina TaxID=215803 RepID=A0A0C2D8E6_9BACT|nr:hypothetical protein [Enhygromyxa salina]KIG17895.1 hypothetical protein DB30_02518 [Enhygromyxa salina]
MPDTPNHANVRIDALHLRAPSSLGLGDPHQLTHDIGHALGDELAANPALGSTRIGGMRLRLDEQALRHQGAKAIARAIALQLRNGKKDSP